MAEIDDKILKKVEELLNETIVDLLYGGRADPGHTELRSAAACFETLKLLTLKVESGKISEQDIRQTLESENVYNSNFIEGL